MRLERRAPPLLGIAERRLRTLVVNLGQGRAIIAVDWLPTPNASTQLSRNSVWQSQLILLICVIVASQLGVDHHGVPLIERGMGAHAPQQLTIADVLAAEPEVATRSSERDELMTAGELAERLRMTRAWVYSETRLDHIPHLRLGRYVRYRRATIESWIAALETPRDPRR
jgi:excisionase family DNA binding protein